MYNLPFSHLCWKRQQRKRKSCFNNLATTTRTDESKGKKGGRDSRRGDRKDFKGRRDTRERKPREEAPEAPDGRVYRGYFTEQDDFVKPVAQSGPPKFKSFGGKKKF